jgi:hypothetical protein
MEFLTAQEQFGLSALPEPAINTPYTASGDFPATKATGYLQLGTQPTDGQTVKVNGITFTFKTSPAGATEVQIGTDIDDTGDELETLLNGSANVAITPATYTYDPATNRLNIEFDVAGVTGNAFTLAIGTAPITISDDTLTGGAAALVAGDDFMTALANAIAPSVPQAESISDEDMVGDGEEHAKDTRLYYWTQNPYTYQGKLNTESCATLAIRGFGGPVDDTPVAGETGAHDHEVPMAQRTDGIESVLSTWVHNIGGADMLFSSMGVNRFGVSQAGAAEPQFSCELIGTGHWMRIRDIAPGFELPDPVEHHYMHGAALLLTLNDGTSKDLSAAGRIRNSAFDLSNNLVVGPDARTPGDPFLVALSDVTSDGILSGAYVRVLNRGKRAATAQVKLTLDEDLGEIEWLKNGTVITSLSAKFVGQKIAGTQARHEFEWIVPKSKIENIAGDTEGDRSAITLNFKPLKDPTTKGLAKLRIRNGQTTME